MKRFPQFLVVLFGFLGLEANPQNPIPPNDDDLERVMQKIPPVEAFSRGCMDMRCVAGGCTEIQAMQKRVRDARMYMKYMHYWLTRAAGAHLEHLKNVAGESMMAADRAAKIQNITAYQQWVVSIASALLEISSAAGNFMEIVRDPKLLQTKTRREMAEIFDKFYEGMKDAESFIKRLMEDRFGKDFPEAFANMLPAFAGLTDDQMSDLKSHLSDIYSVLKAGVEYSGDWRKILKEGKGLASLGQIGGRFLKAYADSEIRERIRLVDELLAGIIANDKVQSQTYKDWTRVQQRRNKAEDVYLAIENLVVVNSNGQGGLTRCLMKHASQCSEVDLSYTSRITVPKHVDVVNFAFTIEEDKIKSYTTALNFFNGMLPEVIRLLDQIPALPTSNSKNTIASSKKSFGWKETITLNFTATACLPKEAWIGLFSTFAPDVDDLAAAQYLLSARARLEGRSSGTVTFAGMDDGIYEARMYDMESGKAVAKQKFIVGKETYELSGFYKNDGSGEIWKFEVYGLGYEIRFGPVPTDNSVWKPYIEGAMILDGGKVAFLNEGACGFGPNGLRVGEIRDILWRLVFSPDNRRITVDHYKFTCDDKGKMQVYDQWVPSGWGPFTKID